MKRAILRKLSSTIEKSMAAKNISAKELAEKSGVSYSSLTPILNGSRECGISKLVAIADALDCTPDFLLNGAFTVKRNKDETLANDASLSKTKYIAIFISVVSVTYCMIYEIKSRLKITSVLQFPLLCGQNADEFLDYIITSIQKLSKDFAKPINNKNTAVFVSAQQYGRTTNRKKIQNKGEHNFSKFIIESDAITNYHAFIGKKNGMCISINDGNAITYSIDNGKNIIKLQGYGFHISDVAGTYWIGCEAIKHVINVKEGVESATLLSDKIIALFDDDIDFLSEYVVTNPGDAYSKTCSVVKELMYRRRKAYEIVEKSADLLMQKVKFIDNTTKFTLPIAVAGSLAYLYEGFIPENRIIKFKKKASTIILDYGLNLVKKIIKTSEG